MLTRYDFLVIGCYFVLLLSMGWIFRRFTHDSSEYFRGGGQMGWWLVGASAFMSSFSAWTFTGAAGLAYQNGIVVLAIYGSVSLGFFINWFWLAAQARQMRVVVVMEAVRRRLGAGNEQFFTWLTLPMQVIGSAITLYALAIFCSPAFGLNLHTGIIVCGVIVVFVSTIGGSWAVATGDFLQALVLLSITLVMAVYSLSAVGGVGGLIEKLPPTHFDITASQASGFGFLWVLGTVIAQLSNQNSLLGAAGRYLYAGDGAEARKASLLAGVLFLFGCLFWFLPPLAARALGIDLTAMFPTLSQPQEGAYVAMAHLCLPVGLFGLMVTAMISAAISSMDHGLNRNSGIFVRSFYLPVLRPSASERELVRAGRAATLVFGLLVILLAILFSTWKDLGVLKLMLTINAAVVIPTTVPMVWCLIVRRAPDWAAWSAVLVGFCTSLLIEFGPGFTGFQNTLREAGAADFLGTLKVQSYAITAIADTVIGSAWYLGAAALFGGTRSRQKEVDLFFSDLLRPIAPREKADASGSSQSMRIGRMAMAWGGLMSLLLLVPNGWTGRLAILFCASFVAGTGLVLEMAGRAARRSDLRSAIEEPLIRPVLKPQEVT